MNWFISDTHFNDTRTIKYIPNEVLTEVTRQTRFDDRPEVINFSEIEQMVSRHICADWMKRVDKDDHVYHLGDVGIFQNVPEAKEFFETLPGYKTLIFGNHDTENGWDQRKWLEVFDEVVPYTCFIQEFMILTHKPPEFTNEPYLWLFGHVHSSPLYRTVTPNSFCVCTERHGFKLVSEKDIFESCMNCNLNQL